MGYYTALKMSVADIRISVSSLFNSLLCSSEGHGQDRWGPCLLSACAIRKDCYQICNYNKVFQRFDIGITERSLGALNLGWKISVLIPRGNSKIPHQLDGNFLRVSFPVSIMVWHHSMLSPPFFPLSIPLGLLHTVNTLAIQSSLDMGFSDGPN